MLTTKQSPLDSMGGLTLPKLHVLLVEDDPMTARAMAKLLSLAGFVPCIVGSFRAAIDAACQDVPDLLISDINLPDKDGWQLLALLRRAYPGMPAVAISGSDKPDDIAHSSAAGFCVHLVKPFAPGQFFEALHFAMES